ncbi:hypothetical protein KZZ08_17330 [Roseovarius mucosus]|uniref:Uncharacterized protein n=1 Tax=Roseovarius mucosus TaxID=215743 RepID=A0A1V0RTN1_9RHOB|nr:hypothetical protein [Roseovarius mucosus]ARE84972.1 hypothetical protein ROSMUCSMR3_03518 [Roseovarius mucosus]MBW4975396.1 hypothetical protein [Roseovarius mucosus]
MEEIVNKLLAAAEHTASATFDLIEAAREGGPFPHGNIVTGDTLSILADAMRLLIEAMPGEDEDRTQLHGAVTRYLESAL